MKELAQNCSRAHDAKMYSKLQAAQHQLEGAIASFFLGNWPAAITLAGAAEEAIPPHEKFQDFIQIAKSLGPSKHGKSEKEIIQLFNEQRNWLKHNSNGHPESMEFFQENALTMIMRALTRLQARYAPFEPNEHISESIAVFELWVRDHYTDWINFNSGESKS